MLPSDIRSLTEAYQSIYAPKEDVVDLSEGFLTEELFDLTDEEIQRQLEEFFLECVEEGYDIDDVERLIYEHIDSSLDILSERVDPGETQRRRDQAKDRLSTGAAMKKAAASSGGEKSSRLSRLRDAVGKAASAAKAGAKVAGKVAKRGAELAGRAVGTAHRAGSALKSAAQSGYERGKGGSSSEDESDDSSSSGGGASSSSGGGGSSSSGGRSSAAPTERKDGLLKRVLKKVVRGAAKVVSTGAGAVKAGADYVADRARKEELEATGLFSDEEIEAIMENIMKGPLLPGERRPAYPAGQAPKPTSAKLPPLQKAGYEPEGEFVAEDPVQDYRDRIKASMVGSPGPSVPGKNKYEKPTPTSAASTAELKRTNTTKVKPNSSVSSPGSDTTRIGGYDLRRLSNSYEPEGEIVDEARRADKEGYARGTTENPKRKDIPHGDPSQRTMLHSRLKRRADEMGRERRSSARNKAGGRTPVSTKEKAFLQAADRTRQQIRNPNVPKTGEHKKQLNNSYDYVLDYLVNEGFAKTEDSAKVIMSNMSEAWIKSILEQSSNDTKIPDSAPPIPQLPGESSADKESRMKRERVKERRGAFTGLPASTTGP